MPFVKSLDPSDFINFFKSSSGWSCLFTVIVSKGLVKLAEITAETIELIVMQASSLSSNFPYFFKI